MGRLINIIAKNKTLYTAARVTQHFLSADFQKLIFGYYPSPCTDYSTILVEHRGEEWPEQIVYNYSVGVEYGTISGYFALLRQVLESVYFADRFGMTPVIRWGKKMYFHDVGMDGVTTNVFEYYFEPVSDIPFDRVNECRNVVNTRMGEGKFFLKHVNGLDNSYRIDPAEISVLASMYRKYIRLNQNTRTYIEQGIASVLNGKKTIGVHVRGTDYNWGLRNHPTIISPEEFLAKAEELLVSGEYEQVFLATEDEKVLQTFVQAFGDNLVYYGDVVRSDDEFSPHSKDVDRPLHHYRLGLEVLRDAYTLANCDGLITGLSQVAFAARYINEAIGKTYRKSVILDKGINMNGEISRVKMDGRGIF